MAPPRAAALTHRRNLSDLVSLALNDLRLIYEPFETAEEARDVLIATLPRLISIYGSAAASLAADWYDEVRAESGARRRFTPATAELPGDDRAAILARWGVGPLFTADPDMAASLTLVSGGLSRIIAEADRQTITVSTAEDPAARGWTWVAAGGCAFCSSQDGTFFSDPSAELSSHDHCSCVAAPVFG